MEPGNSDEQEWIKHLEKGEFDGVLPNAVDQARNTQEMPLKSYLQGFERLSPWMKGDGTVLMYDTSMRCQYKLEGGKVTRLRDGYTLEQCKKDGVDQYETIWKVPNSEKRIMQIEQAGGMIELIAEDGKEFKNKDGLVYVNPYKAPNKHIYHIFKHPQRSEYQVMEFDEGGICYTRTTRDPASDELMVVDTDKNIVASAVPMDALGQVLELKKKLFSAKEQITEERAVDIQKLTDELKESRRKGLIKAIKWLMAPTKSSTIKESVFEQLVRSIGELKKESDYIEGSILTLLLMNRLQVITVTSESGTPIPMATIQEKYFKDPPKEVSLVSYKLLEAFICIQNGKDVEDIFRKIVPDIKGEDQPDLTAEHEILSVLL